MSKYLDQITLAAIIGMGGLGVGFISRMADNVLQMTLGIKELNYRVETINNHNSDQDSQIKEHEQRLRELEKKLKR